MKLYIFTLTILITYNLYSQISDITRFQNQNLAKECRESTPVVISEDEILLFYCSGNLYDLNYFSNTIDTMYYSKSTNAGKSWSAPVFIIELGELGYGNTQGWYLTSLKTSTGRIILAWSDLYNRKLNVMYSDDNWQTWSDSSSVNSVSPSYDCNLSEIDSGRIWFSYNGFSGSQAKYLESTNNGETWSQDPVTFHPGFPAMKNLSFVNLTSKLLAFFDYGNTGIYYKKSTNNGLSWSAEFPVVDSVGKEFNAKAIKFSDEELWIVYLVGDEPQNQIPNDVYCVQSFNAGETWSNPIRFTSYAGQDYNHQAVKYINKAFVSFSTSRYTNKPQIGYAFLGETVEKFRPPYIVNKFAQADSLIRKHWLIGANVIDDEKVSNVNVTFEDGSSAELFDDGMHNDGDSLDNVFANVVNLNFLYPSKADVIDANKITLPLDNNGNLAGVNTVFSQNCIFETSDYDGDKCQFSTTVEANYYTGTYGMYDGSIFLFSGGFLLSGFSDGQLWTNAVASASLVEDYLPGKVGSAHNDPLNKIYTICSDDPPFGPSWQYWKDAVFLGAEFYDGDADGKYDPVDKNWNGTWEPNEDIPMILGDITAWCVYNDALPKYMRRWNTVDPQGIEVRQTVFAAEQSELENVIFIRYSILNTGAIFEVLDSVYFGIWEDADIGDATDDVVGCDTLLQSGFFYGNLPDWVYGDNPPSFFTSLLQGPIVNTNNAEDTAKNNLGELLGSEKLYGAKNLNITSHIFNLSGVTWHSDPNNAVEARNYLLGKNSQGNFVNPCTFPYCEVKGGINCNEVNKVFWASGDPVTNVGWICDQNRDTRNLVSTGPFLLEKGKPQEIIIAYVIGRGTDGLNSITVARENVQRAIQEYQSNFASMTYSAPPATNPVNSYVLYQNYPNPFNPTTTIRYELPQDGVVTIEVFDILGQRVGTLINEYQKADRYEVTFSSVGLASGVYIYQLRLNDFITSKKMILVR